MKKMVLFIQSQSVCLMGVSLTYRRDANPRIFVCILYTVFQTELLQQSKSKSIIVSNRRKIWEPMHVCLLQQIFNISLLQLTVYHVIIYSK